MGKKTKKTKWRTLEIPSSAKSYKNDGGNKWEDGRRTISSHYRDCEKTNKRRMFSSAHNADALLYSSTDEVKVFDGDEYTKITTPRQDVLFKKGYLMRKKVAETASECCFDEITEDMAHDCNEDIASYISGNENIHPIVCGGPQPFIDPSALFEFYGGGYEIYDPYTGNMTVIVEAASGGQYSSNSSCQPAVLTSVPCPPVPLQPVQWFNPVPSQDWCCSYSSPSDKPYSSDSQNGSGFGSESSGIPESPIEIIENSSPNGHNNGMFPPSYVYPGYMFGAPIYNIEDLNVNEQQFGPESPQSTLNELNILKRRRKKKRRRRTEAEDESESSYDDNCSRSISSNDCATLESHSPVHAPVYESGSGNNCLHSTSTQYFSRLPHANVNAPEFVPLSQCHSFDNANEGKNGRVDDRISSKSTNSPAITAAAAAKSNLHVPDNTNIANDKDLNSADGGVSEKSNGLNVYCKPFANAARKTISRDAENRLCSNSSDSGISSPGSEDALKNDFGDKSTRNIKNEESKKKPRSRKANRKNKINAKLNLTPTNNENGCGKSASSKKENVEANKKNERYHRKIEMPDILVDKKSETVVRLDKKKSNSDQNEKSSNVTKEVENMRTKVLNSSGRKNTKTSTTSLKKMLNIGQPKLSQSDIEFDVRREKPIAQTVTVETNANLGSEMHPTRLISESDILPMSNVEDSMKLDAEPKDANAAADIALSQPISVVYDATNDDNRRHEQAQLVAERIVNEVIECAEAKALSSMSCDKQELPLTQAVAKWLNEHENALCDHLNRSTSLKSLENLNNTTRLKQNCVIC